MLCPYSRSIIYVWTLLTFLSLSAVVQPASAIVQDVCDMPNSEGCLSASLDEEDEDLSSLMQAGTVELAQVRHAKFNKEETAKAAPAEVSSSSKATIAEAPAAQPKDADTTISAAQPNVVDTKAPAAQTKVADTKARMAQLHFAADLRVAEIQVPFHLQPAMLLAEGSNEIVHRALSSDLVQSMSAAIDGKAVFLIVAVGVVFLIAALTIIFRSAGDEQDEKGNLLKSPGAQQSQGVPRSYSNASENVTGTPLQVNTVPGGPKRTLQSRTPYGGSGGGAAGQHLGSATSVGPRVGTSPLGSTLSSSMPASTAAPKAMGTPPALQTRSLPPQSPRPASETLAIATGMDNAGIRAVESRFAISLNDLARAGPECTVDVVSLAGLPLLAMKVVGGSRLDVGLHDASAPRCSVLAPTVKGGSFAIHDPHDRPYGSFHTVRPGMTEVSIDGKTVMYVEGQSNSLQFSVSSPGAKPVAIGSVNKTDFQGDYFEIRALPGSDAVLVLSVLLALAVFTHF